MLNETKVSWPTNLWFIELFFRFNCSILVRMLIRAASGRVKRSARKLRIQCQISCVVRQKRRRLSCTKMVAFIICVVDVACWMSSRLSDRSNGRHTRSICFFCLRHYLVDDCVVEFFGFVFEWKIKACITILDDFKIELSTKT